MDTGDVESRHRKGHRAYTATVRPIVAVPETRAHAPLAAQQQGRQIEV